MRSVRRRVSLAAASVAVAAGAAAPLLLQGGAPASTQGFECATALSTACQVVFTPVCSKSHCY
jgi:hypothetical protein